jgi:DNA repair photolyase
MKPEVKEITVTHAFSVSKKYNIEKDFRYPFHLSAYVGCLWDLEEPIPGCRYCYARKMWKRYWRQLDHPYQLLVKTNYPELVAKEFPRMDKKDLPKICRIGTHSEPYGPLEKKYELTKRTLEAFLEYPHWEIRIPTKSTLILRDKELLQQLNVLVTTTITTLNHAAHFEPRAPGPYKRLQTLRLLSEAGIRTRIRIEPHLGQYTEEELIRKIGEEIGVEEIKVKKLNYFKLSALEPKPHGQLLLTQFTRSK